MYIKFTVTILYYGNNISLLKSSCGFENVITIFIAHSIECIQDSRTKNHKWVTNPDQSPTINRAFSKYCNW